jgi:hypothetical protein
LLFLGLSFFVCSWGCLSLFFFHLLCFSLFFTFFHLSLKTAFPGPASRLVREESVPEAAPRCRWEEETERSAPPGYRTIGMGMVR